MNFKPKEYPRLVCKVCKGLMQKISPRDEQDVSVHFWCGSKLTQGERNAMLHVQETDTAKS